MTHEKFSDGPYRRWRERRRRYREERALHMALLELDDHLLKDIGYQPRNSIDPGM